MNAPRVRSSAAVAAAALVTTLVGTASAAVVTSWTYQGSNLEFARNDDGDFWGVYDNPSPNIAGTPFNNGIKLASANSESPTVFTLSGEDYIPTPPPPTTGNTALRGNRLIMFGTASIDGSQWQHPDDTIRTQFEFGFGFSGGEIDLYGVETSFGLFNASGDGIGGVGSGTSLGFFSEPAGYGFGFNFVDRFGFDITSAVTIAWSVAIYFDWTNYAGNDTLQFDIPQNSVDIIAETIPTPGTAGLLALAAVPSLRRRR